MRRPLFKLLVAAAVAVAIAAPAMAFGPDPTTAAARFRFVVLNDVHLTVEDLAVSRAQLRAAVDEINAMAPQIQFVLVAGDLGAATDAVNLQTELTAARDELNRLNVPYHAAAGNHDVTSTGADTVWRSLFGAASYRFSHDGMNFVCVHTAQTQSSTAISLAALDSLSANLAAAGTSAPLAIFGHHPLGPTTPLAVTNTAEFYARVDPYNLKGVFSGHWHGLFEEQRNGVWYCTSGDLAVHRSNHDDTTVKGYRLVTVLPNYSLASRFFALGSPPTFAPQPPVLQESGNRYALAGRQMRLQVSAADADGDAITYTASGLPQGAAFDPAQRLFTWTPAAGQAGFASTIQFTASDGASSDVTTLGVRVLSAACAYEDFEAAPQATWQVWGGAWGVNGGALVQTVSTSGSYFDTVDGNWSDVHFEADLRHDAGGGYAGVVFRFQDANNNYYLWNDGARLQLRRRVGGTAITMGTPIPIGPVAGWHHVRVEAVGSNLKVFWDGVQRIDVTDATFASGRVGFVCSQSAATFDNLVVTGCSGFINRAPVLQRVGDRSLIAGTPAVVDLAATDPDGTPLTYSAASLPPGAAFNPAMRRLTWTPSAGQRGPWAGVTFGVSDGELTDAESVTLTVFDAAGACVVEDFNGVSASSAWTPSGGVWTQAAGEYTGSSASATPLANLYAGAAYENFMLQARVRVAGNGNGGVIFRAIDATHYDYLAISQTTDAVELRKMNGATSYKLAGTGELRGDADTWHHFRVLAEGPRLRIYVDNVLFYDYIETGVTTGGRMYVAGAPGIHVQNATVRLDDLVLASCANTPTDAPEVIPVPSPALDVVVAPNPFNPTTRIQLQLARAGHVRATVFDAAGRAVRTLADEDFAAGSSSLQWNGTNGEGRSMSSGVYFLRVQTAGEARTQRLVLLK